MKRFGMKEIGWLMVLSLVMAQSAQAITGATSAPAAGTFAYDIYDSVVAKILQGPIGFTSGVAAMVFGAIAAIRGQFMAALPPIVGGAMLLKAEAITTSLGVLF